MQHLDEGIIHSWLDGALSAEEAARVKAHVDECPQCAAAVAEARGFIAASSRILTALDNVPKGVVPIGARAKPRNWAAWRAAAAVLVVALGSFAVLRERMGTRSSAAEVVPLTAQTTEAGGVVDHALTDTVQRESSPGNQARRTSKVLAKPAMPTRITSPLGAAKIGNQEVPPQANVSVGAAAPQSLPFASDAGRQDRQNSATLESAGAATVKAGVGAGRVYGERVAEPLSRRVSGVALNAPVAAGAMSDSAVASTPIRVVGTPRVFGEKRTLYEVAPGDTVLLAEVLNFQLSSVVVTGAATTRAAQSADTSANRIKLRGASSIPVASDSQRNTATLQAPAVPAASTTAPAPAVETLNGVTTLTWIDPTSKSTMKLSGRHTSAELMGIKRRIDQLRAAEAAKKKP